MLRLEGVGFAREGFSLAADWELEGPGVTAVIGPSGAGKSTLLALIAGFELPDRGQVWWNGVDLTPLAPGKRPVAMLFQENNLFPHLDVLTNVALGLSPRARPSAEAVERARGALARVGLAGMERRKPGALSGGQAGRAALARVLVTERPLVLMDEPFAALGPAQRAEMQGLVAELLPKATVLMVTHAPEDARFAGQTVFVAGGLAAAPAETAALFAAPPPTLRKYLA